MTPSRAGRTAAIPRDLRGSAVLVVLVLLAVLVALAAANTDSLREFKDEILRIEAEQRKPHGQGTGD